MMKLAYCLAILLLTGSCSTPAPPTQAPLQKSELSEVEEQQGASWVSMVQLIASPMSFDGKRVRVVGFFRYDKEGVVLYLHREDFEFFNPKNGLWVDVPKGKENLSDHYVIVEGTFDYSDRGHGGVSSGSLKAVTRMTPAIESRKLRVQLKE